MLFNRHSLAEKKKIGTKSCNLLEERFRKTFSVKPLTKMMKASSSVSSRQDKDQVKSHLASSFGPKNLK